MFIVISARAAPDGSPALHVSDHLTETDMLDYADKTWPAPAVEALVPWIASPEPNTSVGVAPEPNGPVRALVMWFR